MENQKLNDYLRKLITDYRVRIAKSTSTVELLCYNDMIEDLKSIISRYVIDEAL